MSKQTGAHTHEEKGKNVPVILFFTGLALFFIGLFLGNMLLVKNILFLVSCYFSWLSYYWGRFWRYVSGYEKQSKVFA